MTHEHSALIACLDTLEGADVASVFAELIRAGRYRRTGERTLTLGGHRPKTISTTSGTVRRTCHPVCRLP